MAGVEDESTGAPGVEGAGEVGTGAEVDVPPTDGGISAGVGVPDGGVDVAADTDAVASGVADQVVVAGGAVVDGSAGEVGAEKLAPEHIIYIAGLVRSQRGEEPLVRQVGRELPLQDGPAEDVAAAAAGGVADALVHDAELIASMSPEELAKCILSATRADKARAVSVFNIWRAQNPGHLDLSGVNLSNAYLVGADLSNIALVASNLEFANLSGADLQRTHLGIAHLDGALLNGTIFYRSTYVGATSFVGCDFEDVNYRDFGSAKEFGKFLTDAVIKGAKGLPEEVIEAYMEGLGLERAH